MPPLSCLLAFVCIAIARDGWSPCRMEPCPGRPVTGEAALSTFPWLESVARWETMFPTLRRLGMLLCSAGLDEEQSVLIGGLVEECDRELAALEGEIAPAGVFEPFLETFASEDFDALDLELAEDRVDEFEDRAIVPVSQAVASIREILTESQIAIAAEALRYPPVRPPHGHPGGLRDHCLHRSRETVRSSGR